MSAPQNIDVGAPTGNPFRIDENRVASKFALGHRQVGYTWRWGADVSAPQEIEPT